MPRTGSLVLVLEDPEANSGDQLFVLKPGQSQLEGPIHGQHDQKLRILGSLKDGRLCVQAQGANDLQTGNRLCSFDGSDFQDLASPPEGPTLSGNWHTFFVAQNGDCWLAPTPGRLATPTKNGRSFRPLVTRARRKMPPGLSNPLRAAFGAPLKI